MTDTAQEGTDQSGGRHLRGAPGPARRPGQGAGPAAEALNAQRLDGVRRRRAAAAGHRADPYGEQLRAPGHRLRGRRHAVRLQRVHRAQAGDRGRPTCSPCTASPGRATPSGSIADEAAGPGRPGRSSKDFAELYRYYKETRLAQLGGWRASCWPSSRPGRGRHSGCCAGRSTPTGVIEISGQPGRAGPRLPALPRLRVDPEPPATTTSSAATRTSPSRTRCSSRPSAATSPSRSRTTPRPARASTASPSPSRCRASPTPTSSTPASGRSSCMRIRPYKETEWRHLVFNTRTKAVTRLDGIGQACQRLPEDQGIDLPRRLLPGHRGQQDVRHRRQRPGVRAGGPLAQRRGRALRLPRQG